METSHFYMFSVQTSRRGLCVSICEVKIWNSLNVELNQSRNSNLMKRKYKDTVLTRSRNEGEGDSFVDIFLSFYSIVTIEHWIFSHIGYLHFHTCQLFTD